MTIREHPALDATTKNPQRFRPEVQALRAVAVGLVVLFHFWPDKLPGGFVGVDVFFVISGFLITSHLSNELFRSGTVRLSSFYARRIRRLLPAAFLVLAVTLVGILTFVPRLEWQTMLTHVWTAAVYSVNWSLAAGSVDYFADTAASPLQHYWSLSVEEQFYLAWPLLLIAAWLTRRRWVVVAAIGVVFAGSMAYSVIGAYDFQQFAYFATPTHGWEFAAGALLALVLPGDGFIERRWTTALSWIGWAMIVASALLFTGESPFPGWIALLPVAGAMLIITIGSPRARWSPTALAAWAPVQFVGDTSYSLYLWHWPLIVLMPYALGITTVQAWQKIVLIALCVLLAWLTKRFIEDPGRALQARLPDLRTFIAAATATAVLVAGAFVPLGMLGAARAEANTAMLSSLISFQDGGSKGLRDSCLGAAAALESDCVDSHVLAAADLPDNVGEIQADDWVTEAARVDPYFTADDCPVAKGTAVEVCTFGPDDARYSVALVGDSHAQQFLPTVLALGQENGWSVSLIWKSSCRPAAAVYTAPEGDSERKRECALWKRDVAPVVADAGYDLVITSGAVTKYNEQDDAPPAAQVEEGLRAFWDQWLAAGEQVLVVGDGPVWDFKLPACLATSDAREDPCAEAPDRVLYPDPLLAASADYASTPALGAMDVVPSLCDDQRCHAVVGGMPTLRDRDHYLPSFAVTFAPLMQEAISQIDASAIAH